MNHSLHKTVKISEQEAKEIEEFLILNPLFDFSTLARTAIREFIRNPQVKLTALKSRVDLVEREAKQ